MTELPKPKAFAKSDVQLAHLGQVMGHEHPGTGPQYPGPLGRGAGEHARVVSNLDERQVKGRCPLDGSGPLLGVRDVESTRSTTSASTSRMS